MCPLNSTFTKNKLAKVILENVSNSEHCAALVKLTKAGKAGRQINGITSGRNLSCTPCKFMTCKCIFRQRQIVSLYLQRKVSVCIVFVRKKQSEFWNMSCGWWLDMSTVWVRLCSHHTWITLSESWITIELLRRVYQTTLTKQMGSLSFMLPVEKFKRNGTHMYLPFQKFDLNPQFYNFSMTVTLLFSVLDIFFIVRPLNLRFIVQKISHSLISLGYPFSFF